MMRNVWIACLLIFVGFLFGVQCTMLVNFFCSSILEIYHTWWERTEPAKEKQ